MRRRLLIALVAVATLATTQAAPAGGPLVWCSWHRQPAHPVRYNPPPVVYSSPQRPSGAPRAFATFALGYRGWCPWDGYNSFCFARNSTGYRNASDWCYRHNADYHIGSATSYARVIDCSY